MDQPAQNANPMLGNTGAPPEPTVSAPPPPPIEGQVVTPGGDQTASNKKYLMYAGVGFAILLLLVAVYLALAKFYLNTWPFAPVVETPVVQQAAISSPTPSPDETATWKTYGNGTLGFSFKYPDDWEIISESTESATLPEGMIKTINIGPPRLNGDEGYDGVNNFTVYDLSKTTQEKVIASYGNQFTDRQEKREDLTINRQKVLKVTVVSPSTLDWTLIESLFQNQKYLYTFGNGAIFQHQATYDKIVQTIKIN